MLAEHIFNDLKNGKYRQVAVLLGAGASVESGIPDFRSPSGIYEQVAQGAYGNLQHPTDLFNLSSFNATQSPLYNFTRQFHSVPIKLSSAHIFLQWLHEKQMLRGCVTQNFDGLELQAGLPNEKVVQLHGSIRKARCVRRTCRKEYSIETITGLAEGGNVSKCVCGGPIKPDIVLFGESVRDAVTKSAKTIISGCDLLIIMGTSLKVAPAAHLPGYTESPILLINKEPVTLETQGPTTFEEGKIEDILRIYLPEIFGAVAPATPYTLQYKSDLSTTMPSFQRKNSNHTIYTNTDIGSNSPLFHTPNLVV